MPGKLHARREVRLRHPATNLGSCVATMKTRRFLIGSSSILVWKGIESSLKTTEKKAFINTNTAIMYAPPRRLCLKTRKTFADWRERPSLSREEERPSLKRKRAHQCVGQSWVHFVTRIAEPQPPLGGMLGGHIGSNRAPTLARDMTATEEGKGLEFRVLSVGSGVYG